MSDKLERERLLNIVKDKFRSINPDGKGYTRTLKDVNNNMELLLNVLIHDDEKLEEVVANRIKEVELRCAKEIADIEDRKEYYKEQLRKAQERSHDNEAALKQTIKEYQDLLGASQRRSDQIDRFARKFEDRLKAHDIFPIDDEHLTSRFMDTIIEGYANQAVANIKLNMIYECMSRRNVIPERYRGYGPKEIPNYVYQNVVKNAEAYKQSGKPLDEEIEVRAQNQKMIKEVFSEEGLLPDTWAQDNISNIAKRYIVEIARHARKYREMKEITRRRP